MTDMIKNYSDLRLALAEFGSGRAWRDQNFDLAVTREELVLARDEQRRAERKLQRAFYNYLERVGVEEARADIIANVLLSNSDDMVSAVIALEHARDKKSVIQIIDEQLSVTIQD